MKKLLFLCFIGMVFFLSSCCSWAGDDKKDNASTACNYTGRLVTKTPTDFDVKFGYEVLVYSYSNDSNTIIDKKVFISKNTWERLPVPNDTTIVNIEYVENIEYGENTHDIPSVLWDFQFNMCTGYTVEIKK
jgi:hypothetical protein